MPIAKQQITPCLWYDKNAEEAANFYITVFKNSKINNIVYFGEAGQEVHGGKPGAVLVVDFELDGQKFSGLNGGPLFKFSEAISFQVPCETQEEIDYYWSALTKGGSESECGWLKDKFGLSWQVFPTRLLDMLRDPDRKKADRAMSAMMTMSKIDLATIERAYAGQ
ncbi:MAG: VOC family protein [Pseudolabrys sp.]|nr:VOC family protein [Pseudolabrys sp.]MDP2295636.1 VOC family protein [Pseudolabrys sp.]